MSKEKITAYKGFDKDIKCRGFQYEVGKEYEQEDASVCNYGFHACENPLDVLDYYNDINNKYCIVESSGKIDKDEDEKKFASSKIKIVAEIGFVGLFKAGIEWLKEVTSPERIKDTKETSSGDYAKIGSSGDYAKIGSSGYSAKIGSSGDSAQIESTGEDSVICCAGHNSMAKAKIGSWITLSEWVYSEDKKRYIPKCVKTEYVDGERIKADTWYKLIDGEFIESDSLSETDRGNGGFGSTGK